MLVMVSMTSKLAREDAHDKSSSLAGRDLTGWILTHMSHELHGGVPMLRGGAVVQHRDEARRERDERALTLDGLRFRLAEM